MLTGIGFWRSSQLRSADRPANPALHPTAASAIMPQAAGEREVARRSFRQYRLHMRNSERPLNRTAGTGLAVLVLAVAGYLGSAGEVPTVRSPLPLATTLPTFWFWMGVHEARELRWVVEYVIPTVVGPLLLLAWHPRLLAGADEVPRLSPIGLVLISILTVADLTFGWQYGVKYQGKPYTVALVLLNAVAMGVAWVLLWFARKRRTFWSTLVSHAFVAGWLVWIAFPWLGELP